MKLFQSVLIYIFSIFHSVLASGATCEGKIDRIQVTKVGGVQLISIDLYGNGVGRTLCNLSVEWKGATPEACQNWHAKLLAHQAQSKRIRIQYNDSFASCSDQLTWDNANTPWMISDLTN